MRWHEFDELTRSAFASPGDNWIPQLDLLSVGPKLESTTSSMMSMAENSVRQVGFVSYEIESVNDAAIDRVEFLACSDSSAIAAVTSDGTPIELDLSTARDMVSILVVRDADGSIPWKVAEVTSLGRPC